MMDVEADGHDEIEQFGNKLTGTMPARFGTYLEQFALEVISEAKSNLQNNKSVYTGELLASIRILDETRNGFEITIGSTEPYAKYVEYGRGPVSAGTAKALSFIDRDSGKRIFVKKVGPAQPKPFLAPAVISKMNGYTGIITEKETQYVGELT